jgi:hypothetical protein
VSDMRLGKASEQDCGEINVECSIHLYIVQYRRVIWEREDRKERCKPRALCAFPLLLVLERDYCYISVLLPKE